MCECMLSMTKKRHDYSLTVQSNNIACDIELSITSSPFLFWKEQSQLKTFSFEGVPFALPFSHVFACTSKGS